MKKLRFFLNKDFDKFMTLQFLDEKGGGVDFGKGIIRLHPTLSLAKKSDLKTRKKIINGYFDEYYRKNRKNLINSQISFKVAWRIKEKEFFKTTEGFFGGFKFQPGMYICYLSIVDCNPRFLESKTFQVFYKKNKEEAIYTIAHELLHFIFFDYVNRELKKEISNLSEEKLWDLSEIFNVVILKLNTYKNIVNKKYIHPYPNHKKFIPLFEKTYNESKGVKEFILKGIKIIKRK